MVKLICFVKRKPGMDADEFHRYWREVHGPLIASTRSGRHVLRYEQNHRVREHWDQAGYDGVTEQWFTSVDDFFASLQEDDYPLIDADVAKFIDTDSLEWIITEEPEVFVGG
jgi:uncharacterized protein (TIGR02118 family)